MFPEIPRSWVKGRPPILAAPDLPGSPSESRDPSGPETDLGLDRKARNVPGGGEPARARPIGKRGEWGWGIWRSSGWFQGVAFAKLAGVIRAWVWSALNSSLEMA
jgi:hypothetical protein